MKKMSTIAVNAFFDAVKANNVSKVAELLGNGSVSVNAKDTANKNMSALHYAVELNNKELFTTLMTFKPNINMEDDEGYVPLILAVDSGSFDMARILIVCMGNMGNNYVTDIKESNPQLFNEAGEFIASDSK